MSHESLRHSFRDYAKLTDVQGETFDAIHDANQVKTHCCG